MKRFRTSLQIVLAGSLVGAVSVGVLSRLAMFLLIVLNPDAEGVRSDDDFEMGRFTVGGSLNLLVFGLVLGALSGLFYLAFERLRFGPPWFATGSLAVGAGVVPASLVVHDDGVDFTLLEPLALTVGLFVLIPVLHIAALDLVAVRIRAAAGAPTASARGTIAWVVRGLLAALAVAAAAALVADVRTLAG